MSEDPKKSASTDGQKSMIEAIGLSKFYGPFVAVQDVTFSVPKGQVAAFLGPNGAGKSTTMKLLTGFLAPTSGQSRIGGFDMATQRIEASQLIGYLPENGPLYDEMTPTGLLKYLGQARGMSSAQLKTRLDFVIDRCSLSGVLGKTISKLSRGYRQRVGMAQALLHDPDVLILDDIHVLARRSATQEELFHTFNALHSFGKQIVLSSHISPSDLTEIEPRLISRFEWGLTLEIKSLKHEHRETLIKHRSTEANFPLSEDVAPFLVQTFPSTQSLLIAFDALLMRAEDKKISSVDVAQTQILLQDLIAAIASKEMTPKHIISYVAEHFDVEKSDLLGKAQTKEFS